ncbi:MAG TPA: hypothetical protein VIJ51_02055 [Solirubrobacteraceae bacterium]
MESPLLDHSRRQAPVDLPKPLGQTEQDFGAILVWCCVGALVGDRFAWDALPPDLLENPAGQSTGS